MDYDFSGWATKNDLLCSDGRTIRANAFMNNDGKTVPLVWNHSHDNAENVLGHALLENRANGVYAYGKFNDSEQGKLAKILVQSGDITSLSIWANKLKQTKKGDVLHGDIKELSLVLAGANPGASIDFVSMAHGEEINPDSEYEATIYMSEDDARLELYHADTKKEEKKRNEEMADNVKETSGSEETVKDVFDTLSEKQKTAVYAIIGGILEENGIDPENEGDVEMAHSVFDDFGRNPMYDDEINYLSQSDIKEIGRDIVNLAKEPGVGSLKTAMQIYANQAMRDEDSLAHGLFNGEDKGSTYDVLFPEYKDLNPGAPEQIKRDLGWVDKVISGVHKSPIARVRTRKADVKSAKLRALGYKKGDKKKNIGNIKLIKRTTDPQTIYVKDELHRDDVIDITDFDIVAYEQSIMKDALHEEIATAILIGDGREDTDENKISEDHVRPVWTDDELYTIHRDVDIAAMKAELQGTNTGANFGENFIYAEAISQAALYAKEDYRGKGSLTFFCTPHLKNVMKLARDLNGRKIYETEAQLEAALDVSSIQTAEQLEGKIRVDEKGNEHKLLGIMINLSDYYVGSVKGGEITNFEDFDIDFNKYKYLMETRMSGALTDIKSAIVLEELVEK